jgi:hypothetical protein
MVASSASVAADKPQNSHASTENIERTLKRVIIPKLEFKETSLQEALDFLASEIRRQDTRGHGVPFLLEFNPLVGPRAPSASSGSTTTDNGDPLFSPADARLTVSLHDIQAGEALRYVTGLSDTQYRVQPDGIHIVDYRDPEPMFTHNFRIPADFFPAFEREDRLGHTDHVAEMKSDFAAYLASNDLKLPTGATATLNGEATRLMVHTTDDQFAAIQRILDTDRPAAAFPVPGPKIAKVFEGPPRKGASEWRNAETDNARKMRIIRLPKVTLQNVNLYHAGNLLTKMSMQYDHARKGTKRGVFIQSMILTESPGWPPSISYSATDVSLLDAVRAIARLSRCQVQIGETRVWWGPHVFTSERTSERTYLLPPSTAAQLAKWPEFINQDTPVEWMRDSGVNLLSNGNACYIARRHHLIVGAAAEAQKVIERANENAWRDYYASQKTKALKEK